MLDKNPNTLVADTFKKLAKLFTLRAEKNDFFRVRSSENTAQIIESLNEPITNYINSDKTGFNTKIKGVGKASEEKIIEILTTGKCEEVEQLLKIYPQGVLDIMEVKGLGPKKAKALYEKFGVDDKQKLKNILEKPDVLAEISIKSKTIENLKEALEQEYTNKTRHNISDIYDEIIEIRNNCKKIPEVLDVEIAGSFRRLESSIGDIDIIITCNQTNRPKIIESYKKLPNFIKIINAGETKVTAISKSKIGVDLRIINPDEIGACLQYFTGNRAHNIKIRQIAKNKGWKINEYGLYDKDNKVIESKSEEKIYEQLGLQYIPPTLRQGSKEIDLAKDHKLHYLQELDINCEVQIDELEIPSKIYIIQNTEAQALETTKQQMISLGKNKNRKFIFDTKNTELAIKLLQIAQIEKDQVLNCLYEDQLNRTLNEFKAT